MGDFIRFGNNDKGNTNAFYASTFRPHPYHSPEFVACEYLFYLFSGDGAAAGCCHSLVMYEFSLFSCIVVSLLLDGKKHARINAMGIMKITLWSRNDTWEPDNRMWHIQFYGSIYDPPHEKGSHTITLPFCASLYSYFRLRPTVSCVSQNITRTQIFFSVRSVWCSCCESCTFYAIVVNTFWFQVGGK